METINEQHLSYRATGDVIVLDGDGSRWVREGEATCPSWAEGIHVPVDADGNVVPLRTDTLYTHDGNRFCVEGINYLLKKNGWIVYGHHERPTVYESYSLRCLHLAKPDSWERLLDDLDNVTEGEGIAECLYMHRDGLDIQCSGCRLEDFESDLDCSCLSYADIAARIRKLRGDAE